jgi:hypothetical protein
MHRIKYIPVIFTLLLLNACIKPFDPQIESNKENKYIVSGRITDTEGWQEVEVSLSSPVGSPKYLPVSACQVNIFDDKGNVFSLEEYLPGRYRVWVDKEYLNPGTSYQVRTTTPGGEELVSGFDTMPAGPVMDSVYYQLKDIATADPEKFVRVMQFYVDLHAEGKFSQYYKWEIYETWEYHAAHPAEYYYDGTHHTIYPPDYTNNVCWITALVKNIYTVSTKGLYQNTYNQYPLHSISGHSSRLGYMYSILVRQLALSERAYNYWEQLRVNSNEQGGLYEKQPLAVKGNMVNVNHPENDVLGYFFAASESSRRYFYKDIEGLELDFGDNCMEDALGRMGWLEFTKYDYPVWYYYNEKGYLRILTSECIDCRVSGGKTEKPDFWPK